MKTDPGLLKTDEELLKVARDALTAVFDAIDGRVAGADFGDYLDPKHDDDCPEDDTCSCPVGTVLKRASNALNEIEYRLRWTAGNRIALRGERLAHRAKKLEGNQVVTACNLVHHHERYHLVETRPDLVPLLGCHVCFPEEQHDYLPPRTHLAIHGRVHRDGTRTKNIGCMDTGTHGWTLRGANKAADEGDPGAIVEVIDRKACPTHGIGGEEEDADLH